MAANARAPMGDIVLQSTLIAYEERPGSLCNPGKRHRGHNGCSFTIRRIGKVRINDNARSRAIASCTWSLLCQWICSQQAGFFLATSPKAVPRCRSGCVQEDWSITIKNSALVSLFMPAIHPYLDRSAVAKCIVVRAIILSGGAKNLPNLIFGH